MAEFTYDELPEDIQEKVREELSQAYYEGAVEGFYEVLIDEFKERLEKEFGISDVDVEFSGFHSQGDGASFTGEVSDIRKFLEQALELKQDNPVINLGSSGDPDDLYSMSMDLAGLGFDNPLERLDPDDLSISIVRSWGSRHHHSGTIKVEIEAQVEIDGDPGYFKRIDSGIEQLEKEATGWAREQSDDLYAQLEASYEELMDQDRIEEWIREYDFVFDAKGKKL